MISGSLTVECDECGVSAATVEIDGGIFVPVALSSGSLYVPLDGHWPAGWVVDDGLDLCPKCSSEKREVV